MCEPLCRWALPLGTQLNCPVSCHKQAGFWQRAAAPLKRLLERNGLKGSDVDAVEMLGGGSRVPRLQVRARGALSWPQLPHFAAAAHDAAHDAAHAPAAALAPLVYPANAAVPPLGPGRAVRRARGPRPGPPPGRRRGGGARRRAVRRQPVDLVPPPQVRACARSRLLLGCCFLSRPPWHGRWVCTSNPEQAYQPRTCSRH